MEQHFGMTPTGRRLDDPVGELVELVDVEDMLHTAIVFAAPPSTALVRSVELVLSFLEYPMVMGISELSHHDLHHGVFIYPTGQAFTLKELLRRHAASAQVVGLRAALELSSIVARILADAAEVGAPQGCFSHADLSPWRIVLGHDGRVELIGHGLVTQALANPVAPDDDGGALCYAPPERWRREPEDARSDLYSLAAIAFEVATGRPLHPGHQTDVLRKRILESDGRQLIRGAGFSRLAGAALAEALASNPEERPSPSHLADIFDEVLAEGRVDGDSLAQVLERVTGHAVEPRRAPLMRGRQVTIVSMDTASLPFQVLRPGDPPAAPSTPEPAPPPPAPPPEASPTRWERVAARARHHATEAQEPTEAPDVPRRRRRRRLEETPAALPEPVSGVPRVRPPDSDEGSWWPEEAPGKPLLAPPPEAAGVPTPPAAEPMVPATPAEGPPPPDDPPPAVPVRRRLTRSGSPSVTSRRRRSTPPHDNGSAEG